MPMKQALEAVPPTLEELAEVMTEIAFDDAGLEKARACNRAAWHLRRAKLEVWRVCVMNREEDMQTSLRFS